MRLKILSYNIHKGLDWKNQRSTLEEIKKLIDSSQADLVLLQEVVGKNKKWSERGLIDTQIEYLADKAWPHPSYARNAVYDHGHHGNMILSRYPIESFHNVNISTNLWEKRGMLIAKISLPHPYHFSARVICLHLNLLHSGRKLQYEFIKRYMAHHLDDHHTPMILAGDLNDWNQHSSLYFEQMMGMKEVHKAIQGEYARTFPAIMPLLCLDRIYVKNLRICRAEIFHPSYRKIKHASDHLPLFCEVEIYEKKR